MTSQFFTDTDVNIMVALTMTENGSIGQLIVYIYMKVGFHRRNDFFFVSIYFQHFRSVIEFYLLLIL